MHGKMTAQAAKGSITTRLVAIAVVVLAPAARLFGQAAGPARVAYEDVVAVEATPQHRAVRPGGQSAIALHFQVKDGWHYYADPKTAPGGMSLKIKPQAQGVVFGDPILPASAPYFDKSSGQQLQVFGGQFVVYLPFTVNSDTAGSVQMSIGFDGAVCSETLCQRPMLGKLRLEVPVSADAAMDSPAFRLPAQGAQAGPPQQAGGTPSSLTVWVALPLSMLAGLILNLMPCVWPVLPIVVIRLVEQSRQSRRRSLVLGATFCVGIVLFFVVLAIANIVLRLGFGTAFQWGDHFRNPAFLIGMAILMVVLALFMFGVFSIGVPSSIAGRAQGGKGLGGSVGMGFLAAVLATPCSFAILTAAFAWAQTQPLPLSTAAILLIGVGMALPYLVLTAVPGLLRSVPKPGRWMELVKQGLGFLLLIIAIKLVSALPRAKQVETLYFAAIVAFCVWIWGGWVTFSTKPFKKWLIRAAAVIVALSAGFLLFRPEKALIEWKEYDSAQIEAALGEKRAVLVEFMADWCINCKIVDKTVYNSAEIADLMQNKGVLAVRADTTLQDYPATLDLKNVYNEPAVPVSILLRPDGEAVRLRGIGIGGALKEGLRALPDRETKVTQTQGKQG